MSKLYQWTCDGCEEELKTATNDMPKGWSWLTIKWSNSEKAYDLCKDCFEVITISSIGELVKKAKP